MIKSIRDFLNDDAAQEHCLVNAGYALLFAIAFIQVLWLFGVVP